MKLVSKLAVFALILGLAAVVPAYAEDKPAEKDDPTKMDFEALFKDCDKVLTLNFTADDVKNFKDNWVAGADLLKDDKEFQKLKKKNIKEAFEYVIKAEAYIKWAKEKKLDADAYLRKSLRIMFQHVKLGTPDMIKTQREALAAERKEKEAAKEKGDLTAEQLKEYMTQWDAASKMLDNLEKGVALIPAPTDAEKKLLEDNKADIEATMKKDES